MTRRLDGRVAIVTGGGSGIGQATVRRFHAEGATVVALDVNEDGLATTVDGLAGAVAHVCDITDSDAVNDVFAAHSDVTVLVNAAGVGSAGAAVDDEIRRRVADTSNLDITRHISDRDFDRVMKVNLYGSFYCLRAAVDAMVRAGRPGSIVNISSVAALVGFPLPAYYPASKAGVIGMTRAVAAELAARNIRVNAVAPGATDTPMLRGNPPAQLEKLLSIIPLGRPATPDEIATTILFLASDDSAMYTGQTLSPNGGQAM